MNLFIGLTRQVCCLLAVAAVLISPSAQSSGQRTTQFHRAATGQITILDQNGQPVASAKPSATSQIVDVTVGPGGMRIFSPDSVNIAVGDTVRWTWGSDLHSVTSGEFCTPDNQYCSPNDMNCSAGTLSNTGTVYSHTFGQAGDYTYFCSLHCSINMIGTVHVAAPVQVMAAVSRKTHGGAGTFDINLPLTGTPGIECRSGGASNDYAIVVTFSGNVSVTGNPQGEVILGTGCVGTAGVCNGGAVSVNGAVVTVPLTNIADDQTINVRLNGVNSVADRPATDVIIPMTRSLGDTNGTGSVSSADVAQTKSRIGQALDNTNFRSDVNGSGGVNSSDVTLIKQNIP